MARNNSGQALVNQSIKVRISLNANDATSAATFYSETRTVTTNALGLFNVQIGSSGATSTFGNISNTEWTDGSKTRSIKVELDVNNSGVFTDMGSQQLVSVPFALAANTAVNSIKIGGRTVDSTVTPIGGQALTWNAGINVWQPATITANAPVIKQFSGQVPNPIASSPNWIFIGPTQSITISGSNKIVTGNFSVSLGTNVGTGAIVSLCACWQNSSGGAVTPFNPSTYPEAPVESNRKIVSYSGAVPLANGTYNVGPCLHNNSGVSLNYNDYYTGYIQVF